MESVDDRGPFQQASIEIIRLLASDVTGAVDEGNFLSNVLRTQPIQLVCSLNKQNRLDMFGCNRFYKTASLKTEDYAIENLN